jgi:dihydrolipoamide dehydrogenase
VEKIAGIHVDPIDYGNVPGCTYASPEIASVGLTEKQAEKRIRIKIGKFPFSASEKQRLLDGFVKVILMLNTENG